MIKRYELTVMIIYALTILCSCTLMVGIIDGNAGFSEQLAHLENAVRDESWEEADKALEMVNVSWKKIKPWIQIDIDHDYVHELEENLARLEGYIASEERPDALATMLMIKETWEDMESL